MIRLISIIAALTLISCGSASTGDHTVLLNATQSEWIKGELDDRQATAHFWAWSLAGKPGPDMADTIDLAASNLRECIDAVEVMDIQLKAKDTAVGCWTIMGS